MTLAFLIRISFPAFPGMESSAMILEKRSMDAVSPFFRERAPLTPARTSPASLVRRVTIRSSSPTSVKDRTTASVSRRDPIEHQTRRSVAMPRYTRIPRLSTALVTKGPVATAGSILSVFRMMGAQVPIAAAMVMDMNMLEPTTNPR